MKKISYLIILVFISTILFFIPSITNATEVSVTRNVYSNDGSMKFNFTGLTLDKTHEYEYGLTRTASSSVENWYLITEYTESTVIIDVKTTNSKLREIINTVDTGYITIRDKTTNTIVLEHYSVDLKMPFLNVTNYTVIPNGKDLDISTTNGIKVPLRDAYSRAYYQYEKITDQSIINRYKEIKSSDGDILELQNMLKTTVPTTKWKQWEYFNGHTSTGMNGYGYTQRVISAPDNGLYYMWVYFSKEGLKDLYGYILVDNLKPTIALESVSLPKTEKLELGKTLTLTPTFNPSNATNKIVTWSSSDETIATIDNGGKITPKKLGSTIITVESQDGSRKATCTVTVIEASSSGSSSETNKGDSSTTTGDDDTVATGKLPQAGIGFGIISLIIILISGAIFSYIKYSKLK